MISSNHPKIRFPYQAFLLDDEKSLLLLSFCFVKAGTCGNLYKVKNILIKIVNNYT